MAAPARGGTEHDHHGHGGHEHPDHRAAHQGGHDHAVHGDAGHDHAGHHHAARPSGAALNRTAFTATVHCLTGCAIGEVLGMVIGTANGWAPLPTIALSIGLAFLFGYGLTMLPLLRAGLALGTAVGVALASDTLSIAVMETVDNLIMVVVPGALDAGLGSLLFWGSLAFALLVAGAAAFPVNRWLIVRGKGHAVVHRYHGH